MVAVDQERQLLGDLAVGADALSAARHEPTDGDGSETSDTTGSGRYPDEPMIRWEEQSSAPRGSTRQSVREPGTVQGRR